MSGLAAAVLAAALGPLLLAAGAAGTHGTTTYEAGAHAVSVTGPGAVAVATDVRFDVSVMPAAGVQLRALTQPGRGTPSTPVRPRVEAGQGPGRFAVLVSFPVRGAWTLGLLLQAPDGRWVVGVPVTVAAPVVIPVWLGWAIGLSPLAALAVFLGGQARRGQRLAGDPTLSG